MFNRLKSMWKASTLGAGERPPLPNYVTGYRNGFESIALLQSPDATLDPADANEGRDNAIVQLCINYVATSWQMGVPQVGRMQGAQFVPDSHPHPFLDILRRPNPSYDMAWLQWASLADYYRKGNSYLYLTVSNGGDILAMDWIPARYCRPVPDRMGRVLYYEYIASSGSMNLRPEYVVHHRYGVDELNPLQGVSPFAAAYREIITDNAYSDYAGGLAQAGGVPPIMFSTKLIKDADGERPVKTGKDGPQLLTDKLREMFSRKKGRAAFLPQALDMHKTGFQPDQMALLDVRAMPETRLPAMIGLNALVLLLYTGVVKSNYNNMREAIKQSWRGGILPTMGMYASAYSHTCLPMYPGSTGKVIAYDTSNVEELKSDKAPELDSSRKDFEAGILTLEEVRAVRGLMTDADIIAALRAVTVPTQQVPGDNTSDGNANGSGNDAGSKSLRYYPSVFAPPSNGHRNGHHAGGRA